MKRLIAFLLCLILLCPLMLSCSSDKTPESDKQTEEEKSGAFTANNLVDQINAAAETNNFAPCFDFNETETEFGKSIFFKAFDGVLVVSAEEVEGEVVLISSATSGANLRDAGLSEEDAIRFATIPFSPCTPTLSEEERYAFFAATKNGVRYGDSRTIYWLEQNDWSFAVETSGQLLLFSAVKNVAPVKKTVKDHTLTVATLPASGSLAFTSEIAAEATGGAKFDPAVFARNQAIEKTYGCAVKENTMSSGDLSDALLAGEYVGDFIFATTRDLINVKESLLDLVSLSNVTTLFRGKTWWDYEMTMALSLGEKQFFYASDAVLSDALRESVILYHKDLLKTVSPDTDPYQLVSDGKWTVDTMYEIMAKTPADKVGYASTSVASQAHLLGSDRSLAQREENMSVTLSSVLPAGVLETMTALRPLLTASTRRISNSPVKDFSAGNTLFCEANLNAVFNQSYPFDVGVLPYPKENEQQKTNVSPCLSFPKVFAIPSTVEAKEGWEKSGFRSAAERSAYLLEIFVYESYNALGERAQTELYKSVFPDEKDLQMLSQIQEGRTKFDPALSYLTGMRQTFAQLIAKGADGTPDDSDYDSLLSLYGARVTGAKRELEALCAAFAVQS